MNTIEELIQKECPVGVEFKELETIGEFISGLSGKSKDDFVNGNAKFITYMNVYSNPALNLEVEDKVKINEGEKQNLIEKGDILFTGSSETPDECGMSSVVLDEVTEPTYLNSFCFGFRLFDKSNFDFGYLKHLFRGKTLRALIAKTANGVTRYNVSKKLFAKIEIPVPPLSVQHKIVEILDKFTSLEAELEAELEARKKQYEYYRNQLLDFTGREDVEWKTLGECGEFIRGGGLQKKDFTETGFPCIHYGQIHTRYNTHTSHTVAFTSEEYASKLKKAQYGDLLIATTSEDVDACCKAVTWLGNSEVAVSGDMYIYRHTQNPRFMSYLFKTKQFADYKKTAATGTKVVRVSGDSMANFKFAFPSLAEQEKIASILDKFEALINGQTASLAAEIKARHQQYEYYRDRLLTFSRKEN